MPVLAKNDMQIFVDVFLCWFAMFFFFSI